MDVVGFTVVFMGLGIGMLAIWLDYRRKKLVHEERLEALRQGITPPDWLGELEKKHKTPRERAGKFFIPGLILLLIGAGSFLGCTFMGLPLWIGFWASSPGWVGLALIVVGVLILKNVIDDQTSD